jgi:polyribonucleotide nucleotidyltransferase
VKKSDEWNMEEAETCKNGIHLKSGRRRSFSKQQDCEQANGAVRAQYGETIVLTTACIADTARKGIDFFPLLVDFEERFYSAGRSPEVL